MDSTDILNALVLKSDDLPPPVKEILSRMEPGDKLEITAATVTLVENGEKVVHFALNEGDSITIKDPSNPDAKPVTFEMGDDDEETNEDEKEDDDAENPEKSAAVESLKNASAPEDTDVPPGEK
jgi:hypothetical protein